MVAVVAAVVVAVVVAIVAAVRNNDCRITIIPNWFMHNCCCRNTIEIMVVSRLLQS